jgi:hypothetical protein
MQDTGLITLLAPLASISSLLFPLLVLGYATWTYIASRRLAHIPGPWITNYTSLPLLAWIYYGTAWSRYGELCKTYGPLVRIAPDYLITGSTAQWKKMYAARGGYPRSGRRTFCREGASTDSP